MLVTRIAYAQGLNAGKLALLHEQAQRLGQLRSEAWQRYGSVAGAPLSDRQIRDGWLAGGTHESFQVLANSWKETLRDAIADIRANRESAKVTARQAINRRIKDPAERKRLFGLLKRDKWGEDTYLARLMRKHFKRGKNHTHNQIIVRSDQYRTWTLIEGGNVWLSIPGLAPRQLVKIPLSTTVAPTGTLRVILRGKHQVEVHHQVDDSTLKSAQRPTGSKQLGVDKGYSAVLVDSDGESHGVELGELLRNESDKLKARNTARAKLRSIANTAARKGNHAKAARIKANNLGTVKKARQHEHWKQQVRRVTFTAVNTVVSKANYVAAEDLTKSFAGRKKLSKNMNRRLTAWTKGVTAQALHSVSQRRGSTLVVVNAAYTSQVDPVTGRLATRRGDKLYCPGGVVWQADHAAAINILARTSDRDITLHTPHKQVRAILLGRADRQRMRLPIQDSSPQHHRTAESEQSDQVCSTTSKK